LDDKTYKDLHSLASEAMMAKLHYLYEKATDEILDEKREIVF